MPVVPLPMVLPITTWPGRVYVATRNFIHATGFCVGWKLPDCLSLEKNCTERGYRSVELYSVRRKALP